MSTTVKPKPRDPRQRIPATWATYQRLLADRGERNRPKYLFLNRTLTIVSPGAPHERLKKRIGGLIEDLCVALEIDFVGFGETTLVKSEIPRAGNEPDESYYLTNIDLMRTKKRVVLGEDPAPDLVVEIVFSRSTRDAIETYRRFGVRELWLCKASTIVVLVLGADGRYAASESSAGLPFLKAEELAPWIFRDDPASESRIRALFRAWIAAPLAPRRPARAER